MALNLWFDFMELLFCVTVLCDTKDILRRGSLVDAVVAMLLDRSCSCCNDYTELILKTFGPIIVDSSSGKICIIC